MRKLKLGVMILGCAVLVITANAATNDVSGLLQKGLFEEEANRNLEAAIQAYQGVIAQTDKDRKFGATAIFRLGECYRKLGKTNEANEQYARIVREFPEQTELVKLSQQYAGAGALVNTGASQQGPISNGDRQQETDAEILARQLAGLKQLPPQQRRILVQQQYGNPVINALMQKLVDTEEYVAIERHGKNDLHPDVIQGNQAIQHLQKQIDQQVDGVILGLELKVKAAQETAAIMEARRKQEAAVTKSTNNATVLRATSTDSVEDEEIRRIQSIIKNSPDLINAYRDTEGTTPLYRAVNEGQLKVAKFLLDNKANIEARSKQTGKTPLMVAAETGNGEMLALLLDHGADVNATQIWGPATSVGTGLTALHHAANRGYRSIVEDLIAHRADLNAKDSYGRTPLHLAADKGYRAVVEVLLKSKAEVNASDQQGDTPLFKAVVIGNIDMVKLLLDAGAQVNSRNNRRATPLFEMSGEGKRLDLARLLLDHKADVNMADSRGMTPLIKAAMERSSDMARLLIDHGANVNARMGDAQGNSSNWSALNFAVGNDDEKNATLLLENHADPNTKVRYEYSNSAGPTKVNDGSSPLHMAVLGDHKNMVNLLLKFKANINAEDANGNTPLLLAIIQPEKQMAELLVNQGADLNIANAEETTPLLAAMWAKKLEVVSFLIAHGADVNARDRYGLTPLDRTDEIGAGEYKDQLVKLLRDNGAISALELMTIRVTRPKLSKPVQLFRKDKDGLNRYSLLELAGRIFRDNNWFKAEDLMFPDLNQVTILRRTKETGKMERIKVALGDILESGDCSKDVWLEWGDVVEIPETDHRVDERWAGLSSTAKETITKCAERKVQIKVKGQAGELTLKPFSSDPPKRLGARLETARLREVVHQSGEVLASSDLAHVKVKHFDPVTKKAEERVYDLVANPAYGNSTLSVAPSSNPVPGPLSGRSSVGWSYEPDNDLWLRDGDVIEIPEKP